MPELQTVQHNNLETNTATILQTSSDSLSRASSNLDSNPTLPHMHPTTPRFSESPNARSKSITTAEGVETYGILNRHSAQNAAYQVGVFEDKGSRRSMEDAHSFVVDYAGVRGQGFFAVFDGHAGKHAAEWCGAHFHEYLLDSLRSSPGAAIPDVLNQTFHGVDTRISRMCEDSQGKIHSGCTAVTAFLRIEDADGHQSFIPGSRESAGSPVSFQEGKSDNASASDSHSAESGEEASSKDKKSTKSKKTNGSRIARALKNLGGASPTRSTSPTTPRSVSPSNTSPAANTHQVNGTSAIVPPTTARRVLYSANAGDARGVLCRAGKAVRLTYDHKGSDKQEAKRITDAGGFVLSGRVNGVLAVTRSLGDSSMKEFVVGSPYTTETELCDEDEFLILACDGLWDITGDQGAIDLVRHMEDAQEASQALVNHALARQTNDNVTVMVVRFKNKSSR